MKCLQNVLHSEYDADAGKIHASTHSCHVIIGTSCCEDLLANSSDQDNRIKRIEVGGAVAASDETNDCRGIACNVKSFVFFGCNSH